MNEGGLQKLRCIEGRADLLGENDLENLPVYKVHLSTLLMSELLQMTKLIPCRDIKEGVGSEQLMMRIRDLKKPAYHGCRWHGGHKKEMT